MLRDVNFFRGKCKAVRTPQHIGMSLLACEGTEVLSLRARLPCTPLIDICTGKRT